MNTKQKIKNGKQYLKIGDEWYSTARVDCTDQDNCGKCRQMGECVFFKECNYMFLRDIN